MGWWYVDSKLAIYSDVLVAVIKDPQDWRPGEIAGVESIIPEGPGSFMMELRFHDHYLRRERFSFSGAMHGRSSNSDPRINRLGIYYRYPEPLNGNPADREMVRRGAGLRDLMKDYDLLRDEHPDKMGHLSQSVLKVQYSLIFPDCPLK